MSGNGRYETLMFQTECRTWLFHSETSNRKSVLFMHVEIFVLVNSCCHLCACCDVQITSTHHHHTQVSYQFMISIPSYCLDGFFILECLLSLSCNPIAENDVCPGPSKIAILGGSSVHQRLACKVNV